MTAVQSPVVPLAAARELGLVGGKAVGLAALTTAGFPVPDGFVVPTSAYAEVAYAAGVEAVLAGAGLRTGDPAGLAARVRAALLAAPMPPAVATAVTEAYAALGDDVPVAVRSSATAEDLPDASFAGQQDTFLDVVGPDAVLDAVRRCWASLWTDRAVAYRGESVDPGLPGAGPAGTGAAAAGPAAAGSPDAGSPDAGSRNAGSPGPGSSDAGSPGTATPGRAAPSGAGSDDVPAAPRIAVVVQRMVDAAAAGVLFTADPVSGRRTRAVVDGAPGLGDAVVSGAVDPDRWAVEGDRVTGPQAGCLTPAQVRALVTLGRRVEARFGAPQDIEWALDRDDRLWLTQARPITTLYPVPPSRGPGLRVHFNASLAQGLTGPVTPMGLSAFRAVTAAVSEEFFGRPADPLTGPPAYGIAGLRAFADVTPALRGRVGRALLPRMLDVMEARSAVVLRALLDEPDLAVTGTSVLPFVRRAARAAIRLRLPVTVAVALASPAAARRRVERIGRRVRAVAPGPGVAGVVTTLRRAVHVVPRVAPAAAAGFLALGVARKAAGGALDAAAVHGVLRSLPHNVTTIMDLQLWACATRLDPAADAALLAEPPDSLAARYRAGTLPPVLARELAAFLAEHGHRAAAEIDLGVARWRDDPAPVLVALANYRRAASCACDGPGGAADRPDVRFARGAASAEAVVATVVARVRERSRVRAAVTRVALGRTRALAGMRETHKDYLVRLLALARSQVAELGAELVRRDLLDATDDVFFLELAEVAAALDGHPGDLRGTVATRRATYAREGRRRHVPRVLLSDGTEPETLAAPPPAGAIVGTPASAGTVTGPVRVVLDPAGARLEPGEILVVPSTDPGWTPLFLTAGGLVMEMGGAVSHGAVVAREYGIPAVVGVPDATTRLRTGEIVTVDGGAGAVVRPGPTAQGTDGGAAAVIRP